MIHSSVDDHLAIVNRAAMNMDACASISGIGHGVSRYMPKSRMAVSCGNSIFHFLRVLHNNLCCTDFIV